MSRNRQGAGRSPPLPDGRGSFRCSPRTDDMTPQQKEALRHLGSLTELGRAGKNPGSHLKYRTGGKQNGIMLFQMGVRNRDMKCFDLLPEFHVINLRETQVSDAGFRHLSNQHKLEWLDIGETGVSSLHPLRNATGLKVLWCDALRKLGDGKATALGRFPMLEFLDLSWTGITDITVKRLKTAPIRKLSLTGTKITDEGLRHLAQINTLEMLGLYHTDVSDAGLRSLHDLPKLRVLVVGSTRVTTKGKQSIQRAMPKLKVEDRGRVF
jgi:internalin A